MQNETWFEHFPAAITVTDENATIIAMNAQAAETFKNSGGRDLIGQSVIDCHPPETQAKVRALFEGREPNVYTIEKHSIKKLIYQAPFYENGKLKGVVELSLPLPDEVPNFKRD
ncbi:MAG: PAS domain-containing protein [Anaerolineaceae bacterium]|nr:PAS domain-containing protein [Anaerolineaceae bacterium]